MMKHYFSVLLFSFVIFYLTTSAAEENKGKKLSPSPKDTIYQVTWMGENVSGELLINGFVIRQFEGRPSTGTANLNLWLSGRNEIRMSLSKTDPKSAASFSLGVSELNMGDVVSTGDKGNRINIKLMDADLSGKTPKKISKKFNSILDFSNHLLTDKSPHFSEQDVLKYAIKLYGLFQKKDSKSILKAMTVKIEDYSHANYQPISKISDAFTSLLKEEIFKSKIFQVNVKKLKAEKMNNLWHIFDGKEELIRSKASDGSISELPIFIGDIDGKLMVVR